MGASFEIHDHRDAPEDKDIHPFDAPPLSTTGPCLIVVRNESMAWVFEPLGKTEEHVLFTETLFAPRVVRTPKNDSKFMDRKVRQLLNGEGIEIVN